MKATNSELVSLIAGELDARALADRHGVSLDVVNAWRGAYLTGLRAAESHRSRTRWSRWLIATALIIATVAVAQTLTPMVADQPARADEVNGNFTLLKQWLEAKVGAVGSNLNAGTGAITTGSITTGGTISTTGSLSAGTISATTVSTTGAISANGTVTAGGIQTSGDVRMGTTWAPRADENLRIIRGTVTSSGTTGTGFTATGGGTSTQTITFTRPFSGTPSVVCTVGPGATSSDACNFVSISAAGFVSTTGIRNVQFTNANITFVAIGPN